MNAAKGIYYRHGPCGICGVALRADKDEVIIHKIMPPDAVASCDKIIFGGAGMDNQKITVTAAGILQCLTRANGDNANIYASLLGEWWHHMIVKAGVLGRSGGLDDNTPICICHCEARYGDHNQSEADNHASQRGHTNFEKETGHGQHLHDGTFISGLKRKRAYGG